MDRGSQRGFSLLELLIVLFVVMVIASLVTLNVNSGGQDVQLYGKVRSLADISSYALDEAQMAGVDMGLLLERVADGVDPVYRYSWRERREQGWRIPERDEDIYGLKEFPPDIELRLVLEDLPVQELKLASDAKDLVPQVIFYSSGETTPGFIELRQTGSGDLLWMVEWDLLGRFELLPRGEVIEEDFDGE